MAAGYYLGAQAAFWLGTFSDRIFAPFWPPNIILFWGLLLAPLQRWWLFILAVLPAHIIVETGVGMPTLQWLIAFKTNILLAGLTAYGVRRWTMGPPWLSSLRQGFVYVLVAVIACPAIAAIFGAFVQIAGGGSHKDYWSLWGNWFSANALGAATLGPLLLAWTGASDKLAKLTPAEKLEAAIVIAGLILTCLVTFTIKARANGSLPTFLYLPVPFMVWSALRFGVLGASVATVMLTLFTIIGAARGQLVFQTGDLEQNVLMLQAFLVIVATPTILLGATIEELRRTNLELQDLVGSLFTVQDKERRAVSRGLHEHIGQDLAAAHLLTQQLRTGAAQDQASLANEIEKLIGQAAAEIRTVSQLLYPTLLEDSGFSLALKSYFNQLAKKHLTAVELSLSPELDALPRDLQLLLFRTTQALATSVHKFVDDRPIRVTLTWNGESRPRTLLIVIEHERGAGIVAVMGTGLLGGLPMHSIDLAEARERVRQVKGSIVILEATADRTAALVRIPAAPKT